MLLLYKRYEKKLQPVSNMKLILKNCVQYYSLLWAPVVINVESKGDSEKAIEELLHNDVILYSIYISCGPLNYLLLFVYLK